MNQALKPIAIELKSAILFPFKQPKFFSYFITLKIIKDPSSYFSNILKIINEPLNVIRHIYKKRSGSYFESDTHRRVIFGMQNAYYATEFHLKNELKLIKKPFSPFIKDGIVRNFNPEKLLPLKSYLIYEFFNFEINNQSANPKEKPIDKPINMLNDINDIKKSFNKKYSSKIGNSSSNDIRPYFHKLNSLKESKFFSLQEEEKSKNSNSLDNKQKRNNPLDQFLIELKDSINYLNQNNTNLDPKVLEYLRNIHQFLTSN